MYVHVYVLSVPNMCVCVMCVHVCLCQLRVYTCMSMSLTMYILFYCYYLCCTDNSNFLLIHFFKSPQQFEIRGLHCIYST